jgi:hypothetical protein
MSALHHLFSPSEPMYAPTAAAMLCRGPAVWAAHRFVARPTEGDQKPGVGVDLTVTDFLELAATLGGSDGDGPRSTAGAHQEAT